MITKQESEAMDYLNTWLRLPDTDQKLRESVQSMFLLVVMLQVESMLWSSTFQKYQSWKANGVPAELWVKQVLADFERIERLTQKRGES